MPRIFFSSFAFIFSEISVMRKMKFREFMWFDLKKWNGRKAAKLILPGHIHEKNEGNEIFVVSRGQYIFEYYAFFPLLSAFRNLSRCLFLEIARFFVWYNKISKTILSKGFFIEDLIGFVPRFFIATLILPRFCVL